MIVIVVELPATALVGLKPVTVGSTFTDALSTKLVAFAIRTGPLTAPGGTFTASEVAPAPRVNVAVTEGVRPPGR